MTKQPAMIVSPLSTTRLSTLLKSFTAQPTVNVGVLERLTSLIVGATVLYFAVRRFLLYSGLLLASGYLLYRGVTGHCPLYASEQIDTRHRRLTLPARSRIPMAVRRWSRWVSGQQRFAAYVKRSKVYEQDDHARQVAPYAWQPEDGVGAPD